jgi:hypothetical protein
VVAALGLILARFWNAESAVSHGARIALATGLIALLTSPVAWAATPALVGGGAGVPAVGPDLLNRGRWGAGFAPGVGAPDVSRLVDFLRAHRQGERYFLATVNAMQAAPIIIQTGEPVMAIGGWSGRDPILSVDRFAALVADGQVRYVLVPDLASRGGAAGAGFGGREVLTDGRNAELFRWVIEHGRPVDPALWRSDRQSEETDTSGARPIGPRGPRGGGFGQPNLTGRQGWRGGLGRAQQLYDCRPGVAASTADAPSEFLTELTQSTLQRPEGTRMNRRLGDHGPPLFRADGSSGSRPSRRAGKAVRARPTAEEKRGGTLLPPPGLGSGGSVPGSGR